MVQGGRIACCGMIAGYNDAEPQPGPNNLFLLIARRITMAGFLVPDFAPRFEEARRELSAWLASGRLQAREDVEEGFEQIPTTFLRCSVGATSGSRCSKWRTAQRPARNPPRQVAARWRSTATMQCVAQ